MNKKILLISVVFLISFMLLGCSNDKKKEENKKITRDDIEEIISTNSDKSSKEIELYSDDTKIVFEDSGNKIVFYYSGNEITGYHNYIDYGDEVKAHYALKVFENTKTADKVYTEGKYLVIEYAKSEYENLTLDKVKSTYSNLTEVKKKN